MGATLQAPLFSLSWPRFPLSGRVPRGQAAPSRGLYCEQGSTPCAHFSTFRRERPTRDGLVFGERSSPRYSSFSAFSALAILSFMAPPPSSRVPPTKRCLCRGPPRATKVQQLLIFGLTPSPDEAVQRSDRLLPASGEPGGPARFSPGFRASARKRDRRGLARGYFLHFLECFPTCYVDLVNYPLSIGNTQLFSPDFLCRFPPAAISLPQNSREAR